MGLFIQVDEGKANSVPNVFACGDAASPAGNMTLAVVDGAMAGLWAHRRRWFEVCNSNCSLGSCMGGH